MIIAICLFIAFMMFWAVAGAAFGFFITMGMIQNPNDIPWFKFTILMFLHGPIVWLFALVAWLVTD